MAKIGDPVIYVDQFGVPHDALLTQVWDQTEAPSVNLVIVSADESKKDQYGRQIEHHTSVVHHSYQSAAGRKWLPKQ